MQKGTWMSPLQYASISKKRKQAIYLAIKSGKLKSRTVKKTVERLEVFIPNELSTRIQLGHN